MYVMPAASPADKNPGAINANHYLYSVPPADYSSVNSSHWPRDYSSLLHQSSMMNAIGSAAPPLLSTRPLPFNNNNADSATTGTTVPISSPRSLPDNDDKHVQFQQAANGRKEEQVQVDRRKLEHLIVAGRDSNFPPHPNQQQHYQGFPPTPAETFFTNVMRSTNTVITWPTKLKVGAKTKKDPFVKISGAPDDVERAKKLILSMLETRHTRVTIKIDVAFTDHSHIIGKHGRNTQLAMKQTCCHIHFPDSNRNPDLEKSNMVSIAGPMQMVDNARRILRELSPLVIAMDTPAACGSEDPALLAEDPLIKELSSAASSAANGGGISAAVRANRGCTSFVIRGSVFQAQLIRQAALRIQQRFASTTQAIFSTTMEILQQQHPVVLGPQNATVQSICQRTGATIHYPPRGTGSDSSTAASPTTFLIQGTIDAVLNARKHLIGCLPMSFAFESSQNDILNSAGAIAELEKQHGVAINLRPKRNGETTNVIVKGQERQASAMYEIRRRLINDGGGNEEVPIIAPDFEFMRDFELNFLMSHRPPLVPTLAANTTPSPIASTAAAVFGFPALCPTPTPYSPLPPAPVPSPSMLDLNPRYSPVQQLPPFIAASSGLSPSNEGNQFSMAVAGNAAAPANSMVAERSEATNNSNDPVPEEAPLACGLLQAAKMIQENSNNWKAPGAERGGGFVNSSNKFDYDQQRLMASKAMQEKPLGLRVPNQQWAGLGFSRSMPAPVLRQAKSMIGSSKIVEKSIDFGESSASSTSSGALQAVDEDEEDKIGPWPLEAPQTAAGGHLAARDSFNMTTYFDHLPRRPSDNIKLTDIDDMAVLLSHLHLTKYVDTFREQEVDMNAFLTMTDADLKELGVNTFGARRKLLVAISEMKEHRRNFR